MVYFLLSILFSTLIFLIFKLFNRFGVQTFQAIVFNYWVAFLFGISFIPMETLSNLQFYAWSWLIPIEGTLFISIFTVMALTVQKHSVTVGSIASRTAMIIPAAVLVLLDPEEGLSISKMIGIGLALTSVILSSKRDKDASLDKRYLMLPIILFIGSGLIDLIIGYAQSHLMNTEVERIIFIPSIFGIAASIGTSTLIYRYTIRKDIRWQSKDLIAGIGLGLINYGSIFFIFKAMDTGLLHASIFFPVNNMGIIAAGTLVGLIVFKERLSLINWIGILLGLGSIAILLFAK